MLGLKLNHVSKRGHKCYSLPHLVLYSDTIIQIVLNIKINGWVFIYQTD